MDFKSLGLSDNTLKALKRKGFKKPTKIQEKIIPILLSEDVNIVGQAQTGTGKTAAFGLPIIEKINDEKEIKALILTPTRELAKQVAEELKSLKGKKNLKIVEIYGGKPIKEQIYKLRGANIVVGTPGRLLDHIKRKTINLKNLSYFVLDEADEMLNMGFIEDVEEILKHTNDDKNILLFSATLPREILNLAKKYMRDYKLIKVKSSKNLIEQKHFKVSNSEKFNLLCKIINEENFYGLIFCKTREDVKNLARKLIEKGYSAEAFHGKLSQFRREKILKRFKMKKINILVSTDVAARGIDIEGLTHVINYSLPQNPEYYVHRIGRTGRAGKRGKAITFVEPHEYKKYAHMKRCLCKKL
ncbi:DEAD/DEAH box helicase domain protein [Methanocaldococcus infernus ME]|uniref:DEAD/DEAH box helicase domain protein n=1 Tax=Methanocaldococcus infernus (strain DSM 11812 / JCM 15783 / ME) TaxID=573063 RepID=D5VUD8_METIM|nr:DEAD/DEAH box helicase [Methanocaldococcus infernus]ADG12750.1 DEAD/DEAH box helicase domain protein [Methanocaldococcus infernus ME]